MSTGISVGWTFGAGFRFNHVILICIHAIYCAGAERRSKLVQPESDFLRRGEVCSGSTSTPHPQAWKSGPDKPSRTQPMSQREGVWAWLTKDYPWANRAISPKKPVVCVFYIGRGPCLSTFVKGRDGGRCRCLSMSKRRNASRARAPTPEQGRADTDIHNPSDAGTATYTRWRENNYAHKAQREQSEQSKSSVEYPAGFRHSTALTDSSPRSFHA